jgi:DNA-binding response OmpR family regulator
MTAAPDGTRKRVLVVDDDEGCCSALRSLLRSEGFDVDVASSGEAALLRIAECPPHVLLSDLRMPGMDGVQLLHRARAGNDFPVILMSADGKCEPDVLEAGAFAYVTKPLDIDVVVGAIHDALAHANGHG